MFNENTQLHFIFNNLIKDKDFFVFYYVLIHYLSVLWLQKMQCLYLLNPLPRARLDTRSVFKWSKAGLTLEVFCFVFLHWLPNQN